MLSIDAPRASIIARHIELYYGGQHRHCSGAGADDGFPDFGGGGVHGGVDQFSVGHVHHAVGRL